MPFRSPEFGITLVLLRGLLPASGGSIDWFHVPTVVILTLTVLWHATYRFWPRLANALPYGPNELLQLRAMTVIGGSVMLVIILAPRNTSPFIYFQF